MLYSYYKNDFENERDIKAALLLLVLFFSFVFHLLVMLAL